MERSLTPQEQAIVETLAYYDTFGKSPLTLVELRRYLFTHHRASATLADLSGTLGVLRQQGIVAHNNGFWCLQERERLFAVREQGAKEAALKWKRFSRIAGFLAYIPFLQAVYVTGSVSIGNAHPKSDIDILIEARPGHLWTVRMLVTVVSHLLGRRRYGNTVQNRLCFNHYAISNAPLGPNRVHRVVSSLAIPVWNSSHPTGHRYALRPRRLLLAARGALEALLGLTRGHRILEQLCYTLQVRKITSNRHERYPEQLGPLTLTTSNLIFYYPRVLLTEQRFKALSTRYTH
ncbi:MAG: nucleotidyltransferase domain-containing protein [Candidatus Spechtbacterales bacterium]